MGNKYIAKNLRRLYIREWLADKEMNQTDLAEGMDTTEANVSRWLAYPHRITLDVISGMEDAMGLRPGDLFRHPASVAKERETWSAIETLRGELPLSDQ